MRIGVVSDSHGYTGRLNTILMAMEAEKKIDALFHLGDGYWDLRDLQADLPVYQAAGNCDLLCSDTLTLVELSGARFLLTHGHQQHVKKGLEELTRLARREEAAAALFGHTHIQKMERRGGVLLLNPGAAMEGQYAILNVGPRGAVGAELHTL